MCDPSKIKILEDRSGEGATFDEVRNLVGHPTELDYANVDDTPFYCLDGRINKPVLSSQLLRIIILIQLRCIRRRYGRVYSCFVNLS